MREFKYLGRILHESEDDSYAASRHLKRAREKWNMIARVLTAQGVESRIKGYFYKAIIQAVCYMAVSLGPFQQRNKNNSIAFIIELLDTYVTSIFDYWRMVFGMHLGH